MESTFATSSWGLLVVAVVAVSVESPAVVLVAVLVESPVAVVGAVSVEFPVTGFAAVSLEISVTGFATVAVGGSVAEVVVALSGVGDVVPGPFDGVRMGGRRSNTGKSQIHDGLN